MQPSERRKNKRADYTCSVRIRLIQEDANTNKPARWDMVTMQNVSPSGMLFTTMTKLLVGTMLEFMISSPLRKEPIHCIGQVSRVGERQGGRISVAQISVYSIAALFKNIDVDNKEILEKICTAHLKTKGDNGQ